MTFIKRQLSNELKEMAKAYPVVTLLGPRQSGKTTLVRHLFPQTAYYSLENPDSYDFASKDPRAFLEPHLAKGMIIDEVQRFPKLLSYIQGYVDESNKKGQFILTGSHQLELHASIAQSLAGRTAMLRLLPLSIDELSKASFKSDDYLFRGFYPRLYEGKIRPAAFYRDYVQTYLEKDVRSLINVKDLTLFQKFLKLCAGRVGQLFNAHALSSEVGVSHVTIQNWLSVLEASFVIHLLPAYYENFNKRVVKTPKIYFTDVGLACYLLDIHEQSQLLQNPFRGSLFENLVVVEFFKAFQNQGIDPPLYFFRDQHGLEVDLLIKQGHQLTAVEIKSSATFTSDFLKNLKKFASLPKTQLKDQMLVYAGKNEQKIENIQVLTYKNAVRHFFDS